MVMHKYYILHVNPEPWAIGTISGKRMSPNPNLVAYKAAVKEALKADGHGMLDETFRKFTFYFWRQQARYLDMNDKVRQRNQADATNMQKATEDALQGVLFKNDRDVLDIRSAIVEQGAHVKEPGIIIRADRIYKDDYSRHVRLELPIELLERLMAGSPDQPREEPNRWSDSEDLF